MSAPLIGEEGAIGSLTVGEDFDGVLPWGFVENRPFLRCLHGLSSALLRCDRREDAAAAAAHFEAALAMDRRVGSAVHEAETLARYAAFLDHRGRPGVARVVGLHHLHGPPLRLSPRRG